MKKKFVLALAALVTLSAIGLGTSLALFSDSKSTTTTMTAGSLCLVSARDAGDRVPGPMFYITGEQGATPSGLPGKFPTGVWAPGDSWTRTLTVWNPTTCSTMDAWLDSVQATAHLGGYLAMADKLKVEVYAQQAGGGDAKVAEGTLTQFLAGPMPMQYPGGGKVPLWLDGNQQMKFTVSLDINADNSYQDKTLVVDFTVNGSQMPHNP